jgi:glycosyltransferase involved in cell wall biosynthesis
MQAMESKGCDTTVIIPTFNRAAVIPRAIHSVLAQTRSVGEIIVVDDGSTDETEQVVSRGFPYVRYIRQENAGVSAARNAGIQAARGRWIAFLDSDDEWLPEKNAWQLRIVERYPQLRWCACGGEVIQGDRVEVKGPGRAARHLRKYGYLPNYFIACRCGAFLHTSGIMIAHDLLEKTGGFDIELNEAEDTDLWFRLALQSPALGYVREPCYRYYGDVPGSLSQRGQRTCSVFRSLEKILGMMESHESRINTYCHRYIRDLVFRRLVNEVGQKRMHWNTAQIQLRRYSLSTVHSAIIRLLCILPRRVSCVLEGHIRDNHRCWNELRSCHISNDDMP